jgi:hypothetical protein
MRFLKALVCAMLGECQKVEEAREEMHVLRRRVARLENATQREQAVTYWRPRDAFRIR